MTVDVLTLAEAERMIRANPDAFRRLSRELVKDKSYQLHPMGMEAAAYLRAKRKRLTKGSYRKYEAVLDKLARAFPDLTPRDFEPPVGTQRLEEFMEEHWGPDKAAPRTYNSNLSVASDFFKWLTANSEELHANPMLPIERARTRDAHRTVFTSDQYRAIIACQPELRDRVVLQLMLNYALRKGAVRNVQFQHFDHVRKRLTVFTKGETVHTLPIPDPAFWHELERLILDNRAEAYHYLMPGRWSNGQATKVRPDKQISNHALHDWWYGCLTRAGVVAEGTTSGEKMHKARHTAGQRLLDATGNIKAVQRLMGHKSAMTTLDTYLDWDVDQLAASLERVLMDEADE
jgi:integrase